jgi:hypothetical protein
MLPAAAWYWRVQSMTPDYADDRFGQLIPLHGIYETLLDPMTYPFGGAVNAGLAWLDRLAVLGFVLAVPLTVWLVRRNGLGQMEAAMVLWSFLGLCLPRTFWEDCYSGARVFTPLLMAIPRVALQVGGPLLLAFRSGRP